MRENINKVADRGARLDSLQDKTGEYPFHTIVTNLSPIADVILQTTLPYLLWVFVAGRIESGRICGGRI